MPRDRALLGVALVAFLVVLDAGCRRRSAAARREGDRATAEAEARSQEATTTGAEVDATDPGGRTTATADDGTKAAFRLEQSDYRRRLQVALDQLDRALLRSRSNRELRARRLLLKSDLETVDRATEQDWATLRTKLERDLAAP